MKFLKKFINSIPFIDQPIPKILTLMMADIISGLYFTTLWEYQQMSAKFLKTSLYLQNIDHRTFDPEYFYQLELMMTKNLHLMLIGVFVFNLFFYFFYTKEKLWAHKFVKGYAWAGFAFALITFWGKTNMPWFWEAINFSTIILYLIIALKEQLNSIPVSETKAQ